MNTVSIREGETREIHSSVFPNEAVQALAAFPNRLQLVRTLDGSSYQLTPKGWIGQIPAGGDWLVRVEPKVPIANLFWMLDVAYRLQAFEMWKDSVTAVETLPELFQRLASILAKLSNDRIRKGLYRNYLSYRDELPAARGRIDSVGTLLKSISSPKIVCDYDDQTVDLVENRLILYALELISRLALQDEKVLRSVRKAHRAMVGAVGLQRMTVSDCIQRAYHRLNEDYKPIHVLCRFFIEHVGPGLGSGSQSVLPFVVDMPRLFEMFVAEVLRLKLAPQWRVAVQHTVKLEATSEVKLEIDLVIEDVQSRRVLAVLDTKYKDVQKPSNEDIYQVASYASQMGTNRAFLIYPQSLPVPFRAQIGPVLVESLGFDLSKLPHPDGAELIAELRKRL